MRKATEYGPLVIAECSAAELPPTLAKLMLDINAYLEAKTLAGMPEAEAQASQAEGGHPETDDPGGA